MSLKSKSSGGPHLLLVRRRSSDTLVASGRTLNRVHGLSKYFGNFTDEDNSREDMYMHTRGIFMLLRDDMALGVNNKATSSYKFNIVQVMAT